MSATRTAADRLFSDAHKDAYGFRPSQGQWEAWSTMTDAQLDAEEDRLYAAVERSIREDQEREEFAAARFEAHIASLIRAGAGNRETAIKWDMDAEGIRAEDIKFYGMSYYAYHWGLNMSYFGKGE